MPDVAFPVAIFVPMHDVAFVADQVIVPVVPLATTPDGEAEIETTGAAPDTTTAVHAPQLFDSFDSVIVPAEAAAFLSAHPRTYHVAAEGNVYDSVAAALALPASVVALWVPISVALVPDESVAR